MELIKNEMIKDLEVYTTTKKIKKQIIACANY